MTNQETWLSAAAIAVMAIAAMTVWIAWRKGRPFATGDVFRASRLSAGNHLFPTQLLVNPTSIVQCKPRWIGRQEESIHITHVSSVKIDTGLLFSDVYVETSGGSAPFRCHGHRKADAVQIKTLIERYQTDHYRGGGRSPAGPSSPQRSG